MAETDFHSEDPTAQDVIDALRFAFIGQRDPSVRAKIADALLEYAPETDSSRGIQLILHLLTNGALKVEQT